jgi:hypothetical protein
MLWENSKMLKTTNGGINWFELNPAIGNHRWSLHFVNLNTGYISGDFGEVIKTTDGGTSWNSSTTGTSLHLMDIKFIDAYTGYACGGSSIIIKTTSGGFIGIPPISTQVPKDFMLYQNYPNPFNPTTTIKFAIPKAGFVKLAVYDMLGREVKTLVNESLGAGNYEVKFNSANLSSGIYFYKLITGDFTEVKKMSLIK